MPKPGFYAVRVGRVPGVYTSWSDCESQVKGFSNAIYKKFPTINLANDYMKCGSHDYMKVGVSGYGTPIKKLEPRIVEQFDLNSVYETWTECSNQIEDFSNASYLKFENEEEALEYVRTGGGIQKATKRELTDLEISNKLIKRRKFNDNSSFEYKLRNPEDTVVVFTDGANSENGKRRSRAGIGVYWGVNHPLNTSKRITGHQTSNRAEIYAAVHALNQAKQIGARKVRLYTDSKFVIHSITNWIKKWKANGWKLLTGKEVVNKEDFIALSAAEEGLDVEWIYVRAHARNRDNDEADKLAIAGSRLLLQPENCSEFQNVQIDTSVEQEAHAIPFLLTSESSSAEESLPLILPDVKEKKPYYAVYRGKNPGVYATWTECEQQIKDFFKPFFRKFLSENEAREFVRTGKIVKEELNVPEYNENEFVTVFTDGASSSNGNNVARAGIGVYWGPGNALNSSMRLPGPQKKNRAEIFAAVHALRQAKRLKIKNIRLYTDSQFVIKGITTWIEEWKKNDWKHASGNPVINKDGFIALDDAHQGLNVDWCYVNGHDNNSGNVEANRLANAGCNKSLVNTVILI